MKNRLSRFFGLLILAALFLPGVVFACDTVFCDDFNSYSTGDLNGQGSWTGSTYFDVVNDQYYSDGGATLYSVESLGGGDRTIQKDGTAFTDGAIVVYVRVDDHTGFGAGKYWTFRLIDNSNVSRFIGIYFYADGYIKCWDNADLENIQTYNDDQWYQVEVEWRSSDYKYRVSIDDGTWTDWNEGYLGYDWTLGIDRFWVDVYTTAGDVYFDYIYDYSYNIPTDYSELAETTLLFGSGFVVLLMAYGIIRKF